jgi:hypothetical protein
MAVFSRLSSLLVGVSMAVCDVTTRHCHLGDGWYWFPIDFAEEHGFPLRLACGRTVTGAALVRATQIHIPVASNCLPYSIRRRLATPRFGQVADVALLVIFRPSSGWSPGTHWPGFSQQYEKTRMSTQAFQTAAQWQLDGKAVYICSSLATCTTHRSVKSSLYIYS